ncbi:MAG: hypothetical protein ABJF10_17940, partial [Chthoniobacter sp.]|uniref:hypothetical protein n=1 Tax=Chthoniobacter sp. TaxID=2510640 RepID=UPI0032AA48CB
AFGDVYEILNEASSSELRPTAWTRISTFDSMCEDLFATLREKAENMELYPIDIHFLEGADYRIAAELFPDIQRCLIFAAGESTFCESVIEAIAVGFPHDLVRVDNEDEFLNRLEMAVFTMRNQVTGIGLLPSFWQLNNDVTPDANDDLIWQTDCEMAEKWMIRRLAVRDFFALQGALFEPGRSLLRMLPYKGYLKFKTLALRPKIEVMQYLPAHEQVVISVQPIPEFQYQVILPCTGEPEALVERLRKALREEGGEGVRRIFYSAEPDDGQDTDEPPLLEWLFAPSKAAGRSRSSVVLFERHLFCPKPTTPTGWIAEKLRPFPDGAYFWEADETNQTGRVLIAKMDAVYGAIRAAFEGNRYCDVIAEIGRWQGSLLNYSAARLGVEKLDWLSMCASMNAFLDTSYAYFHAGDIPKTDSLDYWRRIDYAITQLPKFTDSEVPQLFRGLIESVKAAQERGDAASATHAVSEFQRTLASKRFTSRAGEGHNILGFDYDPEETFRRVLLDLDADFLLRYVDAEARAQLHKVAEMWRDLSAEAITREFWPAGVFQNERAESLCAETVRAELKKFDLESLCNEALQEFAVGRLRVARWALETGQRMLLAGEQPVFYAAQTEDDLLRSWRSFLGRRLRRVADEPTQPKMQSLDAMRETRKTQSGGAQSDAGEDSDDDTEADKSSGLGSL